MFLEEMNSEDVTFVFTSLVHKNFMIFSSYLHWFKGVWIYSLIAYYQLHLESLVFVLQVRKLEH